MIIIVEATNNNCRSRLTEKALANFQIKFSSESEVSA